MSPIVIVSVAYPLKYLTAAMIITKQNMVVEMYNTFVSLFIVLYSETEWCLNVPFVWVVD